MLTLDFFEDAVHHKLHKFHSVSLKIVRKTSDESIQKCKLYEELSFFLVMSFLVMSELLISIKLIFIDLALYLSQLAAFTSSLVHPSLPLLPYIPVTLGVFLSLPAVCAHAHVPVGGRCIAYPPAIAVALVSLNWPD